MTSYWPPARLVPLNTTHWDQALRQFSTNFATCSSSVYFSSLSIKILVGGNVKGLMKGKADNVQCSLLTYQVSHFIMELYQQAGQA